MEHRDEFVQVDGDGKIVHEFTYSDVFRSLSSKFSANSGSTIADGVSTAGHLVGNLDGTENFDVIGFNLTAGVTYTFAERPTATGGIEDPFLLLFNSDGTLNRYDDDGGAGRSSLLSFTPTTSGTYYIGAASWLNLLSTGGDNGNYTIDVWTSNSPDAPTGTAGAIQFTEGSTVYGQISSASDVDMYKVSLTAGLYHEFRLSGGVATPDEFGENGSVVAQLDILDSHGNVVASGLDYESGAGFIAQETGTFYVRVSSYGATTGGYTIDSKAIDLSTLNPLDSIIWKTADNVQFVDTNSDGVPDTGYVYFAKTDENFGLTQDDSADPNNPDPLISLGWNAFEKGQALMALQEYGDLIGIHWVETNDPSQAQFRLITTQDEPYGGKMYPQDPVYGDLAGFGFFNVDSGGWRDFPQSLERGGFSYEVMLHEFGHGLGFAHPHDTGGESEVMPGVFATTGSYGVYNLAQGVYTVMTYNDGWDLNPDGPSSFTIAGIDNGWSTLGAFDLAGLDARYGLVANFHSGNDTYSLTDVVNDALYQTIYDTGGNDTIAYTGNLDAQIDLTAATLDYSPTGGGAISFLHNALPLPINSARVKGGYTIANGVVIENATGGSGNDVLLGNSSDNVLTGNGGNDTLMGREGNDLLIGGLGNDALDGGTGVDTASYASASAGVMVNVAAGTATGGAGNDTINAIENVIGSAFQDRIIGDGNVNTIKAGSGIDVVTLGGGNDIFVAEQGTKVSTKTGMWSWDVITDFDANGDDIIDLSGLGSFHWDGTNANKDAGDLTYKVYNSINGAEKALGIDIDGQPGAGVSGPVTIVYGNDASGGSPDFVIVLLNTSGVDANDFLFGTTAHSTSLLASSTTMNHQADYLLA